MLTEALLERVEPWLQAGLSEPAVPPQRPTAGGARSALRPQHRAVNTRSRPNGSSSKGRIGSGPFARCSPNTTQRAPHPQRAHAHGRGRGTTRAARPTHPRPHRRRHAVIHQHLPVAVGSYPKGAGAGRGATPPGEQGAVVMAGSERNAGRSPRWLAGGVRLSRRASLRGRTVVAAAVTRNYRSSSGLQGMRTMPMPENDQELRGAVSEPDRRPMPGI